MSRNFLFLQGPLSFFFYRLGQRLRSLGYGVWRVQLCGGDVLFWPSPSALPFQGGVSEWPAYIGTIFHRYCITDLVLLGDWRPMHREAVLIAQSLGITVWVYEEGYVRPGYVTLENNGVNARSHLSKDPAEIEAKAKQYPKRIPPSTAPNPIEGRVLDTIWHHVGNFFLWPFFFRYKTHRPYCIGRELFGLIPRYVSRVRRRKESLARFRALLRQNNPVYFFPLQLDSDSQIRIHSPYSGILDLLGQVIVNFATYAPKTSVLLIKNHPLDNGLLPYARFVASLGKALGIEERLVFVESVNNALILDRCKAVVLCNSTLGLTALQRGKALYCLGQSIYVMPGLAVDANTMPLADFWNNPIPPNPTLVKDFITVLTHDALVPGNFYSKQGIACAIDASLHRMGIFTEEV
ncbi:MAG: capsular biosynthesis protein [Desulfovibrio sp.]|nr:capsular biosynthesis protein [Desulfovibrio sp.]